MLFTKRGLRGEAACMLHKREQTSIASTLQD